MAIALMIVSNEGGKESVTTIAASEQEAREAVGVLERGAGSRFLGVETENASKFIARAWEVMDKHWAAANSQKPTL